MIGRLALDLLLLKILTEKGKKKTQNPKRTEKLGAMQFEYVLHVLSPDYS